MAGNAVTGDDPENTTCKGPLAGKICIGAGEEGGKLGNSGVSIATLDDAKKLYSGFDLCAASTSVSMTINGPAPMLLGFFMNAAIDQQCEKYIRADMRIFPI